MSAAYTRGVLARAGHFSLVLQTDSQMTASPLCSGKECRNSTYNDFTSDYLAMCLPN